ncbi:MAG: hypothetical protein HYY05_02310, partial [Chloroflexi bacterium]|nr:hypothetical protein [Chloroflexota bacterium]
LVESEVLDDRPTTELLCRGESACLLQERRDGLALLVHHSGTLLF